MNECKYYNKHLDTIKIYIEALYEIEDCCSGGICHIVTDDNNFDNDDLQFVIDECNDLSNDVGEERELALLICSNLLKLSEPSRALLFSYMDNGCFIICDKHCDTCEINNGKIQRY